MTVGAMPSLVWSPNVFKITSRRGSLYAAFVLTILAASCPFAADQGTERPPGKATGCELIIEGESIDQLVLGNEHDVTERIDRPGESVTLPPGRYRVWHVGLEGGYQAYLHSPTEEDWFTLTPDHPHRLKLGPPLTPSVKARRQGRFLTLDYELLDASGNNYTNRENAIAPRFTISKDGREIGSGSFKYG
jgi:hypothetical protein